MEGNGRINQLLASLEQIHVKKEEDRRLLEEIKQALQTTKLQKQWKSYRYLTKDKKKMKK